MTANYLLQIWHLPIQVALSGVAGLLSHWIYFIRGEHHMQAPLYFQFFLCSTVTIFLIELRFAVVNVYEATACTFAIISSYLGALYFSIIVYRLFFHRTRHFPGPRLLAATKLWHSWQSRHSTNHLYLGRLQKKYGDFVRTGN